MSCLVDLAPHFLLCVSRGFSSARNVGCGIDLLQPWWVKPANGVQGRLVNGLNILSINSLKIPARTSLIEYKDYSPSLLLHLIEWHMFNRARTPLQLPKPRQETPSLFPSDPPSIPLSVNLPNPPYNYRLQPYDSEDCT
jgi:hypothetical protein